MLKSMLDKLQCMHEHMFTTNGMVIHLQIGWGDQSRTAHMMHDGQLVYDHYLIMIKDIKELKKLDMIMHNELLKDLILQSLISLCG